MNLHKDCCKFLPDTCGTDHTERRGRIHLALSLVPQQVEGGAGFKIKVQATEGKNLMAMDSNGYSDPFIKAFITYEARPAQKLPKNLAVEQKFKGKVLKHTLDPKFDETMEFVVQEKHCSAGMHAPGEGERRIEIQVWDWDKLTSNDFMGSLSIGCGELKKLYDEAADKDAPVLHGWFKMMTEKAGRKWYEMAAPDAAGGSVINSIKKQFNNTPAGAYQNNGIAPTQSMVVKHSKVASETLSDYNLTKVLGAGSFGRVFLAEHKKTRVTWAIKSLKKVNVIEGDDVGATMTERRVLSLGADAGCPFITALHSSFQDPGHLYFVMEFISGGDLMFAMADGEFPEATCCFYTAEILLGLWFMHGKGIVYRDLKLDNVMLAADGHVKIADFGMCKEDMPYGATTGTFCGTPDYLAPEICDAWLPDGNVSDTLKYTTAVDYWTLGVVLYEMATNCSPFAGEDDDELFKSIRTDAIEIGPEISKGMRACILGFLQRDPKKRLGCSKTGERDCKDHVFFKEIDWVKLEKKEVKPPMVPKSGTSNFDESYLSQTPELTPVNPATILEIDQHLFADFSFTVASAAASATEYVPPTELAPSRAAPTAAQREALMKSATLGGKGPKIKLDPNHGGGGGGGAGGRHLPTAEEKAALMAKAMGGVHHGGFGGKAPPSAADKAALMAKAMGK